MFAVPLIKIEIKARHRNGATKRGAEEKKLPRRGYLTEIQAVFRIILLMESLLNRRKIKINLMSIFDCL